MINKMRLQSDFRDYYDNEFSSFSSNGSNSIYNRIRPPENRIKLLRELKNRGLKVIELKTVSMFDCDTKKLVVYTDQYKHNSDGKLVVNMQDARLMYNNYLASRYVYSEVYMKLLQIGSRRFKIMIRVEEDSLEDREILSIEELNPKINYSIPIPIYSVDYIDIDGIMVAVDFNKVQSLDKLGISKYMTPEEVYKEIKIALIAFNKI